MLGRLRPSQEAPDGLNTTNKKRSRCLRNFRRPTVPTYGGYGYLLLATYHRLPYDSFLRFAVRESV